MWKMEDLVAERGRIRSHQQKMNCFRQGHLPLWGWQMSYQVDYITSADQVILE